MRARRRKRSSYALSAPPRSWRRDLASLKTSSKLARASPPHEGGVALTPPLRGASCTPSPERDDACSPNDAPWRPYSAWSAFAAWAASPDAPAPPSTCAGNLRDSGTDCGSRARSPRCRSAHDACEPPNRSCSRPGHQGPTRETPALRIRAQVPRPSEMPTPRSRDIPYWKRPRYSPYRARIVPRRSCKNSRINGMENVTYPGAVCSITWRAMSWRRYGLK